MTKQKQQFQSQKRSKVKSWKVRMFIPNFGFVDEGEESTTESYKAFKAWVENTDVAESDYLE